MLIYRVTSGNPMSNNTPRALTDALFSQNTITLTTINDLWKEFKHELHSARKSPSLDENEQPMECYVLDEPHNTWVQVSAVVTSHGVLRFCYPGTTDLYSTIGLHFATIVGHLSANLLQITYNKIEVLVYCPYPTFPRLCIELFTWARMRSAGIFQKVWYPPSKVDGSPGSVLLSCEMQARSIDSFNVNGTKWNTYLARLNKKGELMCYEVADKHFEFQLNVRDILYSRIIKVDSSLVGEDKVVLLFPDMGGPNSVYLKFNIKEDIEDWLATFKSFSKLPVASPLSHDPLSSLRWNRTLKVEVSGCQATGLNLRGAYVDVCWNNWVFARTCMSPTEDSASWNQTFEIPAPDLSEVSSVYPFKFQFKIRRGDYDKPGPSEDDECLGELYMNTSLLPVNSNNWHSVPVSKEWLVKHKERDQEGVLPTQSIVSRGSVNTRASYSSHTSGTSPKDNHRSSTHSDSNLPVDQTLPTDGSLYSSQFLNPRSNPSIAASIDKHITLQLNANVVVHEIETLDHSYYEKLRSWVSDLDLLLSLKLSLYIPNSESTKLVKIFSDLYSAQCNQIDWVSRLVCSEISMLDPESNTIFRGSSFVTRCVEHFFILEGKATLRNTVGKFLRVLCGGPDIAVELDPSRAGEDEDVAANCELMRSYLQRLWGLILEEGVPKSFRRIFHCMRMKLMAKSFSEEHIRKIMQRTTASFLFLRFYCPALLNPQLYDLSVKLLEPGHRRTLVLVAKILQGFANGVRFGSKEEWLLPMNEFIDANSAELSNWYKSIAGTAKDDDTFSTVNDNSDDLTKFLPVKTFMGQYITSPNLIDEWATYAKLVEFVIGVKDQKFFIHGLDCEPLLAELLQECQHIYNRKLDIIDDLEKEDTHDDSERGDAIELFFNRQTFIFGLDENLTEYNVAYGKTKSQSSDNIASNSIESNGTDELVEEKEVVKERQKSTPVRRITQFLKFSK